MKTTLTESEVQWLIDNRSMSQEKCAAALGVTRHTISAYLTELGLNKPRAKPGLTKKQKKRLIVDSGNGYCIDCKHYKVGGICGKNGKDTGALRKKECFKDKEND